MSDITYIATGQGWLYLTVIVDLADRKVIGWAMSDTLKEVDTTVSAWRMALKNRAIDSHLLFHAARLAIFEYIEGWYNRRRKHSVLNYRTPSQQESYFFTAAMAA